MSLTIRMGFLDDEQITLACLSGNGEDFYAEIRASCPVDKQRYVEISVDGVVVARKHHDGRLEVVLLYRYETR